MSIWRGKQTCPPPSGKNLEVLNLEFGKVVLQEEGKIHQMFQISKCKDFPRGLLVLKVSYHFKAGVYVANIHDQFSKVNFNRESRSAHFFVAAASCGGVCSSLKTRLNKFI